MPKQTFFEGVWRSPEEIENLKKTKAAESREKNKGSDVPQIDARRGRFVEGKGFVPFEQKLRELEEGEKSGKLSMSEAAELAELRVMTGETLMERARQFPYKKDGSKENK